MEQNEIDKIAKELINKVYQPTGFISHKESPKAIWDWSKKVAVGFVDYIIDNTNEGSSVWLTHQKIKESILKH